MSHQQSQQSPHITYALQEKETSLIFDPLPWQPIIMPATVEVSEKDLSVEIPKILVYLQDTQHTDWQQRVTCLKRLQELAPNLQSSLPKLLNPLKAQVHDLRSVSAKEAGLTIQVLARHLEFDSAALKLIPSLVKLLHCGNKILCDVGHQTIKGLLGTANIDIRQILAVLTAEIQASKSGAVQHRLATYLYYLVTMHNQSLQTEAVESYLKSCLKTPNPECRQVGRRTFLVWQQVNRQSAEAMFQTLDYNAQRAICEEVELWVVVCNKSHSQSYHQGVESKQVESKQVRPQSVSAAQQKKSKVEPKVEPKMVPKNEKIIPPKMEQQSKVMQRPQTAVPQKKSELVEAQPRVQKQEPKSSKANSYSTPNINDRQTQDRQFLDVLNRLGSSSNNKVQALQDLLRCLIDFSPSEILQLYTQQNSLLKEIVQELVSLFIRQEDHGSTVAVEVQLDCLEYFLSTLPESLLQEVGPITIVLLSLAQKSKRKEVKVKAEELLQFVSDILTSDLVLPHFIAAVDSTQVALPPDFIIMYLNSLVQQASDLEDDQQFQAVVTCTAETLEAHCRIGQQSSNMEQSCVQILDKLKKSDTNKTAEAIKKLSKTLFVCLKQVINANDKVLSKLLQPVPVEIPKRDEMAALQTNFQAISLTKRPSKPQKSKEELVSLIQMLADHSTHVDIKIQIMQKLANEPSLFDGVVVKDFEELIESLIFHILSNRPHDAELQRLSQKTYALLTSLVCLHQTIPNEGPDIHNLLSQPSVNTPPLSIIEKLVRSILHTYNPDLPAQHQTFANQHAESLLQSIAENFNQAQISAMITELIREEAPPRLQSALRMCEHMIKSQKNVADEELIAVLCQQLNHSDADVRKTVVFCLVEICVRGKIDANSLGQEFMLNPSQVKLVQIYIQRRLQRMM